MVSFRTAVQNGFKKAFDFQTRATRAEYWWWTLFQALVSMVCWLIGWLLCGDNINLAMIPACIWSIVVFIPNLSLTIRRLHDTSRSAWHLLWFLLPYVGSIILLVFVLLPSTKAENKYGEANN